MQALPYQGPKNVRVKGVPDPVLVANDHSCCVRSGRACRLTQVPREERRAAREPATRPAFEGRLR